MKFSRPNPERPNIFLAGINVLQSHDCKRLGELIRLASVSFAALVFVSAYPVYADARYLWQHGQSPDQQTIETRFPPPPGFVRTPSGPADSWVSWLRGLPLKPHGSPVLLHTGAKKWRQDVHAAVIDIDIGKRDLQQCADAIMRLRAEWLLSRARSERISFNDTKDKPMVFKANRNSSYASFQKYLIRVFAYAGSYSLERQLRPKPMQDIKVGDVFIKGGFPGHAVLVVDVVYNPQTGARKFLLMQSYMPAQSMHILVNPNSETKTVWYDLKPGERLKTPEWEFDKDALRTWPE